MQNYQDKQVSTNNQLQAQLRSQDRELKSNEDRIRELEFAVQKLLKTVFGVVPKYKFVLMNEGETE